MIRAQVATVEAGEETSEQQPPVGSSSAPAAAPAPESKKDNQVCMCVM